MEKFINTLVAINYAIAGIVVICGAALLGYIIAWFLMRYKYNRNDKVNRRSDKKPE